MTQRLLLLRLARLLLVLIKTAAICCLMTGGERSSA
jgi:hypothetical protein